MKNKSWTRGNKSNSSSGFYHLVGLWLALLGLTAGGVLGLSQSIGYTICAAGLILMLYALITQMTSIWRNASRETAERNKDYHKKAEAADAYLFGTKTNSKQQ